MACTIELWERRGEQGTQWTAACVECGWVGDDTTHSQAVTDGEMHERGEYHPWQIPDGEIRRPWAPADPSTS